MPDLPTPDPSPLGHPTTDPSAADHTDDPAGGGTAPPEPPSPPVPGGPPAVPGYELSDEVGRGGMGVVYRARDRAFGRDVAVKLLQDKYPAGGVAARRFADEARITGQLQHPGVPAAYQTGTLPDGRPFLAMKLIEGRTLDEMLKDSVADRGRLVAAFEKVCEAVGYAHAHGVVHRDLKPQNVMVGSFGEVQVMDWGLAKLLSDCRPDPADPDATAPGTEFVSTRDAADATKAGSLLGTPAYMAPEQAIGAVDEVDARTDVFGLGAVLCAVLTGHPPYRADSAEDTRKLAARAKLDDALARLDGCGADPGLAALCKRCLSPDKADRPASAGAVAAEVAALRAAADDRARRAELDRERAEVRAAEERKRQRVLVTLGGAVLLALAAGGGLAGWQWRRAEGALADVTTEQGKTQAALERVTGEQQQAAEARGRTLVLLFKVTDGLVGDLMSRQSTVTARDRQFLRDILELWETSIAPDGSPTAAFLRAAGAARIARLQHRLGDLTEAERLFREAAGGYARLADSQPEVAAHLDGLSGAHEGLGLMLAGQGRLAEAEPAFRAALAADERVAAGRPTPANRFRVAHTRSNLGAVLRDLRRLAEAEGELRVAADELARLAAGDPRPEYRGPLGTTYSNLGRLLRETGRAGEAAEAFRAASAEWGALAAADPDDPDYQDGVAAGLVDEATCRFDRKEAAAARDLLARARPFHAAALRANPKHPTYRNSFVNNLAVGGVGALGLGDHAAAAAAADELAAFASDPSDRPAATYNAAGFMAQCVALAHRDARLPGPVRAVLAEDYGRRAVEHLRRATDRGYSNLGRVSTDLLLDPVRDREDFRQLMVALRAAAAPRTVAPPPREVGR